MSDFLSTYRDYAAAQRREAEAARATLMRVLKAEGVTRVEVEFDGSGDSGSIEAPVFFKRRGKGYATGTEFAGKEVPGSEFEASDWSGGKCKKVTRQKTIGELIEDVCYGILGSEHGGWEINEGSFGTFIFRVDDDKVLVTFNQRIESVESYDEEY
jgi:hypothetical protein